VNIPSPVTFIGRAYRRAILENRSRDHAADVGHVVDPVVALLDVSLHRRDQLLDDEAWTTQHPIAETLQVRPEWEPVINEAALLAAFDAPEENA
jgi:hypothetical protein